MQRERGRLLKRPAPGASIARWVTDDETRLSVPPRTGMQRLQRQGRKTTPYSCPGRRWNWSAVYAIAELLEFPDHACSARAFGLGTHRRPPFLIANPLM